MVDKKDDLRVTYSVRLKKDLVNDIKHLAIDTEKRFSELVEEGIELVLKKYKK